MQSAHRKRLCSLITAVSVACASTFVAPLAYAGPDDGKTIATAAHVDAPKTYWENGNFAQKVEFQGQALDIDGTVGLWVGKGWNKFGDNQYQFQIPDEPALSFLGKTGDYIYAAPTNIDGSHAPIWWGFGADTFSTEDFRDGTAAIDLVSAEGPGDVELFTYSPIFGGADRILGTSQEAPHSSFLHSGEHTHNWTGFSRPGRYVLSYRSVARKKDGTVVESPIFHLPVQVGGQRPSSSPTPSLQERWNAAPQAELTDDTYTLSISPLAGGLRDGDDNLSKISFNAKDTTVSGTLTLLIDGYFLTDLEVKNGQVSWDEMLGPLDSSIQAVFTPTTGSAAGRWISAPLQYKHGESSQTTSATQESGWVDRTGTERQLARTTPYQVQQTGLRATLTPQGDDDALVEVYMDDQNFNGFLHGGIYSDPEATAATLDFRGKIQNGYGKIFIQDLIEDNDGEEIRLDILPHPLMEQPNNALTSYHGVLTSKIEEGKSYEVTGALGGVNTAPPKDTTPPSTQPGTPPSKGQDTPVDPKVCKGDVLTEGHVDIQALGSAEKLELKLKDDTGTQSQVREIDDVIFGVHDNALRKLKARERYENLKFLPEKVYLLPQSQHSSLIWPGYSTEHLDYSQFQGPVTLELSPVSHPDGAVWGAFTSDLSEPTVLLNSTQQDYSIESSFATHAHTNWAFSQPGIYTFSATYSGISAATGKKVETAPHIVRFAVGDGYVKACESGSTTPAPHPAPDTKPGEDSTTTPQPSPQPNNPSKPSTPHKPNTKPQAQADAPLSSGDNPTTWTIVSIILAALGLNAVISVLAKHIPGIIANFSRG